MTPASAEWMPMGDARQDPTAYVTYGVADAASVRSIVRQHGNGVSLSIANTDVCRMKHALARERANVAVNLSNAAPQLDLVTVACLREIRPQALCVESWGNRRAALSPAMLELLSHLDGVEALAISHAGSAIAKTLGDRAASSDGAALRSLAFMSPTFDASDLAALAKRANLQSVALRGMERPIGATGPSGIASLATLTRLEHLDLSYGPVTDDDLLHFSRSTELRWLSLESTGVSDAGLAAFASSNELRYVNLDEAKITDASMPVIGQWKHVEGLAVGGRESKISDRAAPTLASLKELRWLDLSSTKLTDAALTALKELPALRRLLLPPTMTVAAIERWKRAHVTVDVVQSRP